MSEAKKSKIKAKEKEKEREVHETARPQNDSVGEMLRVARVNKGLSVEDVSNAIHIRSIQLKAIEEGHLEALPGMTYAIGFVRSYANYLGLSGAEISHKFKAEHGHAPAPSKLAFPEPIAESRMPDPIVVGVGVFMAVVVFVLWTFYSSVHSGSSQIPPAPAVEEAASDSMSAPPEQPLAQASNAAKTEAAKPAEAPKEAAAAPEAAKPAETAAAEEKKPAETGTAANEASPASAATVTATAAPAAATTTATPADAANQTATAAAPGATPAANGVINVKGGKGRVVLKAHASTWVQVTSAKQGVIFRKVMRSGEQYFVPDETGLSLATANAGGLDITVDGQRVTSLGKSGEIIRSITLDPKSLKNRRAKVEFNQ